MGNSYRPEHRTPELLHGQRVAGTLWSLGEHVEVSRRHGKNWIFCSAELPPWLDVDGYLPTKAV